MCKCELLRICPNSSFTDMITSSIKLSHVFFLSLQLCDPQNCLGFFFDVVLSGCMNKVVKIIRRQDTTTVLPEEMNANKMQLPQ